MQEQRSSTRQSHCHNPKTFIIGRDGSRLLLFTPITYDAATGLLYGINEGERPMSLPLTRLLTPYEPESLDWDDEPVQKLESRPTGKSSVSVNGHFLHVQQQKEVCGAVQE